MLSKNNGSLILRLIKVGSFSQHTLLLSLLKFDPELCTDNSYLTVRSEITQYTFANCIDEIVL